MIGEKKIGLALSGGGYRAAALESAVASLKEESKAIKQETLEIKSETKKLREERERMSEDLLQKKHELDQLKTTPYRMKDGDKDYKSMLPCYYVEKTDEVKECA